LVLLVQGFSDLAARLPVGLPDFLGNLSRPVIFTLAAIPALAITYQYGIRQGLIAFFITLAGRQIASALGQTQPDAWAFLVGMLVLTYHAVQEGRCEVPAEDYFEVSDENIKRVRRYIPWIAALGAVYALSTNLGVMMEGPQSLLAFAQGDRMAAINYTVVRALAFLPLRTMSILTTGVFTMDGLGFAPAVGLVSPNPLVAAVTGAGVMSAEALSLVTIARFFNRYPCVLKAANSLRTAMTKLLEVASLVGGMMAANAMAPGFGFFTVAGLYLFNEAAGAPVVRVAVGPVSVILVGLAINLLAILH
jgi:hypothetical protein